MNSTARILIALAAGLAGGFTLAASQPAWLGAVTSVADVLGTLWINGIRMTVIPLVVSLLLTSVASAAEPTKLQALGRRTGVVFLLLISGIVAFSMGLALTGLRWWPPSLTKLQSNVVLPPPPAFSQWLVSLIPTNPFKAAADGAMLPLILFTLALAFALLRLPEGERRPLVALFQSMAEAMLVILGGILSLAPVGVFALSLALAARQGMVALGALAFYVAMLSSIVSITFGVLYLVTTLWARLPFSRLGAALAQPLSVAVPSLSSLAAIPLMVTSAEQKLGYSRSTAGLLLPLTVSILRPSAPIAQLVAALFTAQWNGITLSAMDLTTLGLMVTLTSFSTPGIPNASFLVMVPVFQSIGLPIEGIGLLLAVDVIPDVAKTVLNVTGHMAALIFIVPDPSHAPIALSPPPTAAANAR